jgi:hypothetical protein
MIDNLSQFSTTAESVGIGGQAGAAINAVSGGIDSLKKFGSAVSKTLGLTKSEPATTGSAATVKVADGTLRDWRVSLSIPPGSYRESRVLDPIKNINKFVFPYTPTVTISHHANYSAMDPVHGNYSFMSYENSKIDRINITGDFYCEDGTEAQYWVAAMHFLRSVTKMYFGANSENAGAPPPVLKLNGYGDFVFNNVPVVVTNFNIDLPNDVDYIPSQFTLPGFTDLGTEDGLVQSSGIGYAPVKSTISLSLQPVYSRALVRDFNLQDFVKGNYIQNSDGLGGFI